MTSTYKSNKVPALVIGLCLLLIAFLMPTEVKAETDSVFFQKMNVVSIAGTATSNIQVNELKTNRSMYGSNEDEHLNWVAGFLWSDKYIEMDSFPWTDVLEEIISIFT